MLSLVPSMSRAWLLTMTQRVSLMSQHMSQLMLAWRATIGFGAGQALRGQKERASQPSPKIYICTIDFI